MVARTVAGRSRAQANDTSLSNPGSRNEAHRPGLRRTGFKRRCARHQPRYCPGDYPLEDVRPEQTIVALVDLNGKFLARAYVPLGPQPERAVQKIIQCMQSIRDQHKGRSFEGIGISMPGRVDPETQRLLLAPNLKWSNYDVKAAIEDAMHLQVELANAANACLLSELWSGRMDGIRDAVLVTVSEGV